MERIREGNVVKIVGKIWHNPTTRASFIVTIPKEIALLFGIKKGDKIVWILNPEKKEIRIEFQHS